MALSLLKKALNKLKRNSNIAIPETLVAYLKEVSPLLKEKTNPANDRIPVIVSDSGVLKVDYQAKSTFLNVALDPKEMVLFITQTTTTAPVTTQIKNDTGISSTLARTGVGVYTLTITGKPLAKVWFMGHQTNGANKIAYSAALVGSDTVITLTVTAISGGAAADGLTDLPLLVKVFA